MLKNFLILALISLSQVTLLYPQTPSYYHYTTSDGLASSTVFDVMQDRNGFMWFGTMNGLCKFDGKRFNTFRINDGLNSNSITCLLEGDEGEVYLGNYEKGINLLKNGKVVNFRSKVNGESFNTQYIIKSKDKLYINMSAGVIVVINQKSNADLSDYLIYTSPLVVNRMAKLSENNLIALTSNGLFRLINDKLVKINISGLEDATFFSLTKGRDGSYFVGGKGVIFQIKNDKVIKKYNVDYFDNKYVYQMFTDRNNNIWFSVLGKGFFLIPNGSDEIINMGIKMGLENTQVDSYLEDDEGNIWLGTFGKGVYCLNNLYLRNYTEKDGLNNNNVNCITKEKSGKFLIGTINGIDILENGVFYPLKEISGKTLTGYINSIQSYDDYVYVCLSLETPDLKNASYKNLKFRLVMYPSFFKTVDKQFLYGSMGNTISSQKEFFFWPGTPSWLPLFGDSSILNRVNVIIEDTRKNIWAGTSLGLCKMSGLSNKSVKDVREKSFFPDDPVLSSKINSIYQDNKNNIWFTGVKGFASYNLDNNSVTSYRRLSGYDFSGSTSIVSDNKNRMWVGSLNGLYLFEGNSIKLLNSQTGLPSNEVLSLYYDNNKNILYIGTSNGLSIIDVKLYDSYKHPPPDVKINSIKAGDSVYTNYKNLVFEPEQNNVYLDFKAISFSSPGTVKYKYKLNGKWSETDCDFLNLVSLQNGTYVLQIIAKSQNTEWGKPLFLTFRVKPRFSETIWYKLGILSILITISLSLVIWRMKQKTKKISEQFELTEKINDLKHQALSAMMNPHFIFNSLNSVQYLVNFGKYEEANDYIAMMAKLMRKNLDTAGSGFILLAEEIDRLKLYLDLEKLRVQESFSYEIIPGMDVNIFAILIPNMIIQPFVENSLWHGIIDSGNKGHLIISFSFEDVEIDSIINRSLIIKVTDNGIGIKEAKKNEKEDHISKGIHIIEERLKLLSEKMQIPQPIMFEDLSSRDSMSQGTEVIISLPPPLYKIIAET